MNFSQIETEVNFTAVRSRGPGGQNVNKVSSAALLFWRFDLSQGLNGDEKALLREKLGHMINKENEVFLRSDEYRDLEKNKSRCLEKLREHVERALHKPKPRKATRPTRASKLRKLESKKRRGDVKKTRQKFRY
jgi:ribosome-associated protein